MHTLFIFLLTLPLRAAINPGCFPPSSGFTEADCCHPEPFGNPSCWDSLGHTYSQCCLPLRPPPADCLARAEGLGPALQQAPWWVRMEACCRSPSAQECWGKDTTPLLDHTTGEVVQPGYTVEYVKCCLGEVSSLGTAERFARGVRKDLEPWLGYRQAIGPSPEEDPHRCLYRIRNDTIRHCNFISKNFWETMQAANTAIHALAALTVLPDLNVYVAAYELEPPNPPRGPYPNLLFVSRLSERFTATRRQGLVLPVWSLFGRLGWEMPLALERAAVPWERKIPKLFWRGTFDGNRYSSGLVGEGVVWANVSFEEHLSRVFIGTDDWQLYSRARLVLLGQEYPRLIDARFTGVAETAARVEAEVRQLGLLADRHVPMVEQLKYRYHIDLDGSANSERFLWLCQTETTVFRVHPRPMYHYADSPAIDLQPWVDYVPVRPDLSDLVPLLLRLDEGRARAMAQSMARKAKKWMTALAAHRALLAAMREISEDRGQEMARVAGGRLHCRVDLPEWADYHRVYRRAEEQIFTPWDEEEAEQEADLGMVIAVELADRLRAIIMRNVTRVLECNVGVIAGFHLLAKRLSLHASSLPDQRRAYRLRQLAMIFIFTLRNAVRIPPASEKEWGTSKDEIVRSIHTLRLSLPSDVPTPVAVDHDLRTGMRVGIVSICAYPEDSPILLRRVTPANREAYTSRHGYRDLMHLEKPLGPEVHVQHSKLWLMAQYVKAGEFDWLVWMDCDSIIMNMTRTIDSIVVQYTQKAVQSGGSLEEVHDYSGLWVDSFNPGNLIKITQEERRLSFEAGQLPSGSWAELASTSSSVRGHFGPGVALDGSADGEEIQWANGALWRRVEEVGACSCGPLLTYSLADYPLRSLGKGCSARCSGRSGMTKRVRIPRRCSNTTCDVDLDKSIDILITEEGWGLSSANWIVRGSSLSSYRLLMDAFRTAHDRLPLFGDQDALIWHLTMGTATDLTHSGGRPSFHPRARVIPQGTINAYDALNAHYMACEAVDGPSGHLLVTFPGCRDYRACNPLFAVAHSYSIGTLVYDRDNWAHVRVLGPGERAVEMFERGEDDASITVMNRQKPPAPLEEGGMCPVSYPIHAVNQCAV
ncbi:Protein O-glucosyltransferase 3 [Perkinsus olseni]|uniref:Protein O-glucosyltransferase 3 n=1 Tax=Perkinsus olseni TaxID=32597 RepID=A0A7J6MDE1_PEROL|nr:Protein O-glucosyltransferase 3 [Perkinsus olseni]